ncbi:DUF262 domain-containing protein [Flavobacterium oreochromis]|uniref:GmrSD restriction endonuclease domain-containing protein n=1 Tax=Flavobacterium oreochromis TaxID=2906078 RepID=UPI0038583A6A
MKLSFLDILEQKIEIPIIQRDYAQGRINKQVDKIRHDFLDALFTAIEKRIASNTYELELDFAYGFQRNTANDKTFIPIDGQQRLTTLWLLHWFVANKEKETEENLANFMYETRYSSTIFCQELIKFKPSFDSKSIAQEIRNQSWYFETWDFDPTIQSMLVMLNAIEEKYSELSLTPIWQIVTQNGGPFFFYKLNMDSVGLSDDLYIKMNSRGKPLTEFEYFKANFAELIPFPQLKERFEKSIDQEWIDSVWNIILEEDVEDDIALIVDNSFLNLFNYLTGILASKKEIKYNNTFESKDTLKLIFEQKEDFEFVFDILDAICKQLNEKSDFWINHFYFEKEHFNKDKCRLYFLHQEENLLKRCLLVYDENRGFSLQEHLLLYICLIHIKTPINDFSNQFRLLRNIIINSDFQLRNETIGSNYSEIENYLRNYDLSKLKTFKTDQIKEEKEKQLYIQSNSNSNEYINRLEDSDLLRGCISIFDFDNKLKDRAIQFLDFFDEDEFTKDFILRSNVLLSFGDYAQNDGNSWYNLMSSNTTVIRRFFTTPGFGKNKDIYSKTRPVLNKCLDFLNSNTKAYNQIIQDYILESEKNGRDWKYYFLKYPSFRNNCNKGFYYWFNGNTDFHFNKMKEKQFNGYNWCPFLYEVNSLNQSKQIRLENYNNYLEIFRHKSTLGIQFFENEIKLVNRNKDERENWMLEMLSEQNSINEEGEINILQTKENLDAEDRIEKLQKIVLEILELKK